MTAESNKQVVRRYFEDYHNRRETGLLNELVSDELAAPTAAAQAAVARAFPDYRISVDWQVADDDAVATGWSAEGTHSGPWTSPAGTVETTGRRVEWTATTTLRIRDGRIADVLGTHWDHLGILQQMGAVATDAPRSGA
jgi:predicted ester cyclase